MTDLVPADDIERIVGTTRHLVGHYARAVSSIRTVYILHSHQCVAGTPDLRDCYFSWALDNGIRLKDWQHALDIPVEVGVFDDRLIPYGGVEWTDGIHG